MIDFFGQTLAIGDFVAFEQPKYRNLVLGRIVAFTPKQVRLVWNDPLRDACFRRVPDMDGVMWSNEFITLPDVVIKRP